MSATYSIHVSSMSGSAVAKEFLPVHTQFSPQRRTISSPIANPKRWRPVVQLVRSRKARTSPPASSLRSRFHATFGSHSLNRHGLGDPSAVCCVVGGILLRLCGHPWSSRSRCGGESHCFCFRHCAALSRFSDKRLI